MTRHFTWTDDPADPCSLCVSWQEPPEIDGYVDMDLAVPVLPGGPVDRIYRGVHESCQAAVAAYQDENR